MQTQLLAEQSSAVVDGDYRYRLSRWWGDGPRLTWVMLNPSTADATTDDPTIRRVRAFTKREGFDGFDVVNLYGLRATDPKVLIGHPDPVGWHGDIIPGSDRARTVGRLGHSKSGAPRHPLYVRANQPLVPAWEAA